MKGKFCIFSPKSNAFKLQVRIANSIILSLDIVTEMTIEEFYASESLPYLLAALLNLDPSQVKILLRFAICIFEY